MMPMHKNIYKTDPYNEGQPFLLKEPFKLSYAVCSQVEIFLSA
jgi:hypothetical protein